MIASQSDRQELAALGSLFSMGSASKPASIGAIVSVLTFVVGWIALPVEILTRREFGVRYLSNIRILLAFGPPMAFLGLIGYVGGPIPPLLVTLLMISFGFCLWHKLRIWRRDRAGMLWHSYSFGISHLDGRLPVSDWRLYRFLEPALIFGLSFLVAAIDNASGIYLMFSALALFAHHELTWQAFHERELDRIDAMIEAGFGAAAAEGQPKSSVAGLAKPAAIVATKAPAASSTSTGKDVATRVRETIGRASEAEASSAAD